MYLNISFKYLKYNVYYTLCEQKTVNPEILENPKLLELFYCFSCANYNETVYLSRYLIILDVESIPKL